MALRHHKLTPAESDAQYVLQKVQPALLGLMDGSVSTLAPLFAAAGLTNQTHKAFFVGLAAALGAGISMGLAEALSDDGKVTGRGSPLSRGGITGFATALGGMLHTLPFLINDLRTALHMAYIVVAFELVAIAIIRYKFMKSPLWSTIVQVIIGGGIVFLIGIWLGQLGVGD
ncbi:MAG: hypothetical protein JWR54_1898 [Mucilaginibacter sp.]|jgi:VIT1/CCC1 family predicted Fe2+/Mn2+ transporter|nr:hypothetical protein [Mucilaginibacter sp.]